MQKPHANLALYFWCFHTKKSTSLYISFCDCQLRRLRKLLFKQQFALVVNTVVRA